jgi:hypothetical protein
MMILQSIHHPTETLVLGSAFSHDGLGSFDLKDRNRRGIGFKWHDYFNPIGR